MDGPAHFKCEYLRNASRVCSKISCIKNYIHFCVWEYWDKWWTPKNGQPRISRPSCSLNVTFANVGLCHRFPGIVRGERCKLWLTFANGPGSKHIANKTWRQIWWPSSWAMKSSLMLSCRPLTVHFWSQIRPNTLFFTTVWHNYLSLLWNGCGMTLLKAITWYRRSKT